MTPLLGLEVASMTCLQPLPAHGTKELIDAFLMMVTDEVVDKATKFPKKLQVAVDVFQLLELDALIYGAEFELAVRTSQNGKVFKFLQSSIPEKQQKCKAKYFVSCIKVLSHNNNLQAR